MSKKLRIRPRQAAPYLGISVRTLNDYAAKGLIPYYKLSARCVVYDLADLDAFLESRKVK